MRLSYLLLLLLAVSLSGCAATPRSSDSCWEKMTKDGLLFEVCDRNGQIQIRHTGQINSVEEYLSQLDLR